MLIAIKELLDCQKKNESFAKEIKINISKQNFDFNKNFYLIKNLYIRTLNAVYELNHFDYNRIEEITNFYNNRKFIGRMFSMINDVESLKDFVEFLNSSLQNIEEDRVRYASSHNFAYSWHYDNVTNISMSLQTAQIISNAIKLNHDRKIKILDTDCRECETLNNFRNALQEKNIQSETFAVCYENFTNNEHYEIDRTIFYGGRKFTISNNVFDIVILLPKIMLDNGEGNRGENRFEFFNKAISYLRPCGILILAIPFFRLSEYLSLQILKNLDNIQTFSVKEETLYLIGTKREKNFRIKKSM